MLTQVIVYFKAHGGELIADRIFDHRGTAATATTSTGHGFYIADGVCAVFDGGADSAFGHVITRADRGGIWQIVDAHHGFFNIG